MCYPVRCSSYSNSTVQTVAISIVLTITGFSVCSAHLKESVPNKIESFSFIIIFINREHYSTEGYSEFKHYKYPNE